MQRRRFLSNSVATAGWVAVGGITLPGVSRAKPNTSRPAPLPPGYAVVGRKLGVPPLILYGVALQESKMLFGNEALPYPWTLCVRGEARRFPTHGAAVADLSRSVASGITNVDCGCMQVNWGWNHKRLISFSRALDPYPNIGVGAQILREHFDATQDWFKAVGMYHHPTDRRRAQTYATSVFRRIPQIPGSAPGGVLTQQPESHQ